MTVEVLFFAQLKEILGRDREVIELEGAATVNDVIRLMARRPGWSDVDRLPLAFAVNEEWVDETCPLHDGDRLALLTPVSGG